MTDLLTLNTSSHLEVLVDRLAETLAAARPGPFAQDLVVVQNLGMRRYLTLELTRRWGIVGSLATPFPRDLIRLLDQATGSEGPGHVPFDRSTMLWRLFAELGHLGDASELEPLRRYLALDSDQRKRYQLSSRLAALFDDYLLYRPDLILGWERGEAGSTPEEAWQATLFRQIVATPNLAPHLARQLESLKTRLRARGAKALGEEWPARVTVFGVSSLPPAFLELLGLLAAQIPVELYFVSPTWHYWGDLRGEREGRRRRRGVIDDASFERGHSLLAGLGRQGRDFFNLLQELDPEGQAWQVHDAAEPETDSILGTLQADVFHLRDRGVNAPTLPLPRADASLSVHLCHSPLRELEVLRDQLIAAMDELEDLKPSDILVQVTDLDRYSAAIDAVFGSAEEGLPRWRYSVADRDPAARPPAATFLRLLELASSRYFAADLLDLLEVPWCRQAAAIAEAELPTVRRAVEETRIVWGVDGQTRQRDFDLPLFEQGAWRRGLDRLILGYATGSFAALGELVGGLAPAAGDTVQGIDLLGRFADWVERLTTRLIALRKARRPMLWAEALAHLLDEFMAAGPEQDEAELLPLRQTLSFLRTCPEPEIVLELAAVRSHLREALKGSGRGGFLNGGITFCALQPMRNVPHRVIAIIGLGEAAFPRRRRPRAFDLIATAPRPGDRAPSWDDRYLFLEALLSARKRLILSFVGQSQHDLSERAPSSVLAELLDVIDRTFVSPDSRRPREHLTHSHPLQAFSPNAFVAGSPLQSASRRSLRAAQTLLSGQEKLPPFIARDFDSGAEHGRLGLEDFLTFLRDPASFFCRRVLGLELEQEVSEETQAERFDLDALSRYQLLDAMVRAIRQDQEQTIAAEWSGLSAAGALPVAGLGQAHLRQLRFEATTFASRLPKLPMLPAFEIEIQLEDPGSDSGQPWHLHGLVRDLTAEGLLRFRPAELKPRDLLQALALHLVVNRWQLDRGERPTRTLLIGRDRSLELRPTQLPDAALRTLFRAWSQGRRRPLAFFEFASFAWAEQQRKLADPRSRSEADPRRLAQRAFDGAFNQKGDRHNPAIALLWRGRDPLADDFVSWAKEIWWPFFDLLREVAI